MLFEKGQRARHFELLFVAFYSRTFSRYGTEEREMLQMEPISYLKYRLLSLSTNMYLEDRFESM